MRLQRKLLRRPEIYDYARQPLAPPSSVRAGNVMECVYPNWDNTPRSGQRGLVLRHSSPERFRVHVRAAIERLQAKAPDERLLFIKSWNEWAEGNYLEPDLRRGRANLHVLNTELGAAPQRSADVRRVGVPSALGA